MTTLVQFIPKVGRPFFKDIPISLLAQVLYLHAEIPSIGAVRPPRDYIPDIAPDRRFEWWGENFLTSIPIPVYMEV